jgi:hypothetical protein
MKNKRPDVELIHSGNQNEALEQFATLVAQKLDQRRANPAEMTTEELTDEVLLQPWMLPRETAIAILRLLPVSHQNKHRYRYEDYGCAGCKTKKKPHQSLGFCAKCFGRMLSQEKYALARRAKADHSEAVESKIRLLTGSTTNAKRALQDLARKYPALPENTTAIP